MAHLDEGEATMRANNALDPDEVEDGWVLTCQAVPDGVRSPSSTKPSDRGGAGRQVLRPPLTPMT